MGEREDAKTMLVSTKTLVCLVFVVQHLSRRLIDCITIKVDHISIQICFAEVISAFELN